MAMPMINHTDMQPLDKTENINFHSAGIAWFDMSVKQYTYYCNISVRNNFA